jgi:hypothetical protein
MLTDFGHALKVAIAKDLEDIQQEQTSADDIRDAIFRQVIYLVTYLCRFKTFPTFYVYAKYFVYISRRQSSRLTQRFSSPFEPVKYRR